MTTQKILPIPRDKKGYAKKPVKKPVKVDKKNPNSYADAEYWDELNALLKNAESYRSQMDLQKSRTNEDYGVTTAQLAKQRGRDLSDIANDFAARGIIKSSPYGERVGQYESDYNTSVNNALRSKNRSLQDISASYNNYLDQWRLLKQNAVNNAIQRKLSKLKK